MLGGRIADDSIMLIGDSLNGLLIVTDLSCVQEKLGAGP
jgi:hypothetical protein